MEVMKHISNNAKLLLAAILISSAFVKCSNQKALSQDRKHGTLKDSMYKPQIKPVQVITPATSLKVPTEEQKAFNKKLNYVLDNAGATFDNVSLIRGDISDLKELILDKAVVLRSDNDSLRSVIMSIRAEQIKEHKYAREVEEARKKEVAIRRQTEVDASVRNEINNNIMIYGILAVLFFAIATFVATVWSKRTVKLDTLT